MKKIWEVAGCSETEIERVQQELLEKLRVVCADAIEQEKKKLTFVGLREKVFELRETIKVLWHEAFIHSEMQKKRLLPAFFCPDDQINENTVQLDIFLTRWPRLWSK